MSGDSSEVKYFSQVEANNLSVGTFDQIRISDAFATGQMRHERFLRNWSRPGMDFELNLRLYKEQQNWNMAYRDWYCDDVLSGNIEISKVWEDDRVLAFHHPHPQAEIHVVVIPKEHVPSLLDPMALEGALLASMMLAIQKAARKLGLDKTGFYVRANAAAPGVTPHMHWHIKGPGIP